MWLFLSMAEINSMWAHVTDDARFKDQFNTMYRQMLFELEVEGISKHELSSFLMDQEPQHEDNINIPLSLVGLSTINTIIERFGSNCLKNVMKSDNMTLYLMCTRQSSVQQLIALSPIPPKSSEYFIIAECRIWCREIPRSSY